MTYNPRHIKLLTDTQLEELKAKYEIEYTKGNVLVKLKTRNHVVMHEVDSSFSLRCDNRRVTISPRAIKMWQKSFKKENLFDVLHAINELSIERLNATTKRVADKLDSYK